MIQLLLQKSVRFSRHLRSLWIGMVIGALGTLTSVVAFSQQRNLSYYQNLALTNNPSLKDLANQLALGSSDSLMVKAAQKPQVNANGQFWMEPNVQQFGYDQAITNGGNYGAQLSVSQPLLNQAILKPKLESIAIQHMGIHATSQLTKAQLNRDIANAYISAYSDQRQLLYTNDVLQLMHGQAVILKRLVDQGTYKQLDYLNFQGSVQTQELTSHQLYMQCLSDLGQLNALCGIQDTSFQKLADPILTWNGLQNPDSSIFLKPFLVDSLTLKNQQSLFLTKYKPNLSWFADAGLLSSSLSYAYRHFGASAGLNFTVPIYDGHQRRIVADQIKIKQETRKTYESFFQAQKSQQMDVLLQQLHQTRSLISETRQKLATARQVIVVSDKELQAGNLQISDYLLAVRNLLDIENSLNQEMISGYQILNTLNYWNQ